MNLCRVLRFDILNFASSRCHNASMLTNIQSEQKDLAAMDSVEIQSAADVTPAKSKKPLVMQLVVRRDLLEMEGWGFGPLMAQTAHATAAVLHETRQRPETIEYLEDLKEMRKAVLQTADGASLNKLASMLIAATPPIPHHLWVEQPENIPTCLALAPNYREPPVKKALDKCGCRLWKG